MRSMSDYYSALQLRADRWSAIRECTQALERGPTPRARERMVKRVEELFEAMTPIEFYWAFPGCQAFHHLRRQLETGQIEQLSFAVRRATRALSSGA